MSETKQIVRKSVGGGAYIDQLGGYWARPWIQKRRTWRKLKSVREREAIREASTTDWQKKQGSFAELAESYIKHGCPNKRLEPRPESFTNPELKRLEFVNQYFGRYQPEEIKMPMCLAYKAWRTQPNRMVKGTGERTVDMDLNTLSNVLSYGVAIGRIEINFIRSGRPTFRKESEVKHSRMNAPVDGDELHKLAGFFLSQPRGEVFAWLLFFEVMSGCRISELLRLRLDAKTTDDPGFISGNHLFLGRRSKGGVYPYVLIGKEMKEMITAFKNWHLDRYPKSPWFFPGRIEGQRITDSALNKALKEAAKSLGLPYRTPHGLRSYYVTKRRSDGATDPQIAAEIGDKTVDLINTTYGDRPANWTGGAKLSWLPTKGRPVWRKWTSGLKSGLKAVLEGESKSDEKAL